MKSFLQILFFFFLVTQICFAQLEFFNHEQQQKISSEQLTNALTVNLDSLILDSIIIAYKNSQSIPGIATMIIKDNEVIWNKNYGYRNLQNQLPVEDSTFFLMASISKTFVATAIMQLWENGMIDLENNINNYLPAGFTVANPFFPNDTITVKMLMIMTSSLEENWNVLTPLITCGDSPISLNSFLVDYLTPGGKYYSQSNFKNYPPGQQWNYTSVEYGLLALMVENLTHKTFDEYCRDSIFIPLLMNSSSWFLKGMDANKIATPYEGGPVCQQGWVNYPSAFLRTNKLEILNYLLAYLNNGVYNNARILDSATVAFMLSDQLGYPAVGQLPWWTFKVGLSWWNVFPINNSAWGRGGSWDGSMNYISLEQTEKWVTIWFQNQRPVGSTWGIGEINHIFTNYAHLYGNIYALRPSVVKPYARENIDSVLFRTTFSNMYNHQFAAHLTYANSDSTLKDSLSLFDDGLHGDLLSNDGIYGGYIPPQQTEDFYSLGVSTIDNLTNKYFNTPDICKFTTAGPVVLDSITWSYNSSFKYYVIKPYIHNNGNDFTISNPLVELTSDDPWITSILGPYTYPSLPPGGTTTGAMFRVIVDSTFHGYFNFKARIGVDGWYYWVDSTTIVTNVEEELNELPTEFALRQNYPNPFNPTTTIGFGIPEKGNVKLSIFNILGEEIKILLYEEKEAGYNSIDFNGSDLPSGVYFYQLKAGPSTSSGQVFIDTKKMILLK